MTGTLYIFLCLLFYLAIHINQAIEDAELTRKIKEGDHRAFKVFFDRYHATLFSYLRRRGLDHGATQDLVQNAFLKIWESRKDIDPNKSLRALLFRIGYTRALNFFRDHAKFDYEHDLSIRSDADMHPQDQTSYNLAQDQLQKLIETLPPRRKAVFELCFLEELTYREAAEALGISIKTVENQMAHALKTIRTGMAHLKQS